MIVHIIVTVCFLVAHGPSYCHDEDAIQQDGGLVMGCLVGEAQVKDWFESSIFNNPSWYIRRVRCDDRGRIKQPT